MQRKLYCWHVINDLNGEEIAGTFYEKELQKTNQTDFRIGKVVRKKVINIFTGRIMMMKILYRYILNK